MTQVQVAAGSMVSALQAAAILAAGPVWHWQPLALPGTVQRGIAEPAGWGRWPDRVLLTMACQRKDVGGADLMKVTFP